MTSPTRYKLTLSPPTDTDPPTNPIWTVDDQIGVNPPFTFVKDMATPYNYGAVGDGTTDDTAAMQRWLDAIAGRAGYGQNGNFAISATLKVSSNTTIFGAGKGSFVISKITGFAGSMLWNKNLVSAPNPQIDANISIYGTTLRGLASAATTDDMMDFLGVSNLTLRDCKFESHRWQMLACNNCVNISVENCEFYDWGKTATAIECGSAMWFGYDNYNIRLISNWLHEGEWTGILMGGKYSLIQGNRIETVKEAGIFGPWAAAGGMIWSSIDGNVISGVTRKDISAHGMELGPINVVISNNIVENCEGENIHLTDPSQTSVVGNILRTPARDNATFPAGGCIVVNSFDATAVIHPDRVLISDNNCSCADGKSDYAIILVNTNSPSSLPMTNVLVTNNNLAPAAQWGVAAISVDPNAIGTDFEVTDNLGDYPVSGVVTLTTGTAVVNTPKITANSLVLLTAQDTGTSVGALRVSARTPATSFTILSTDLGDSCPVAWSIIEPV